MPGGTRNSGAATVTGDWRSASAPAESRHEPFPVERLNRVPTVLARGRRNCRLEAGRHEVGHVARGVRGSPAGDARPACAVVTQVAVVGENLQARTHGA